MTKVKRTQSPLTVAKRKTIEVFGKLSTNTNFPQLYDNWQNLAPQEKERSLMYFTLLATPLEWISSYEANGKQIKYIKAHIATRILNLLFGVGNWTVEITQMNNQDDDRNYISFGYGYLVVRWFDGTERRIPTAGSGKMSRKNSMVSKGDDIKAVISDMKKKALANMGFFGDIYGSIEAVEDIKGTKDEVEGEKKPTYSYEMLSGLVDKLIIDYMNGEDVSDRYQRATQILKEAKFNDLLAKVISSIRQQ